MARAEGKSYSCTHVSASHMAVTAARLWDRTRAGAARVDAQGAGDGDDSWDAEP